MKDLWMEATEEAWTEADGNEPTDARVEVLYQAKLDRLIDHADALRKRAREESAR